MALRCYACKESIDDDSCFCDQCGKQIFKCGACGHLGKGPRCPQDGGTMQPRRQADNQPAMPTALQPGGTQASSTGTVLHLRSPAHGLDLLIKSGDLLGRRFGPHADVLQRFSQISSNHLELRQDVNGRWHAKDLNSFNHSFYNGAQLAPHAEVAIAAGGVLSLGDIALTVSIE